MDNATRPQINEQKQAEHINWKITMENYRKIQSTM